MNRSSKMRPPMFYFVIFVVVIVALGVLVGLGVIPGEPGPHISDTRPN